MKTFMAIYIGSMSSPRQEEWTKLDEATRSRRVAQGMKAWHDWMTAHKAAIVFEGGPLGKTKRTSLSGVADTKNDMTGFVVLRAENHEAAARLFENHPHFAIFPGDSVEIMECLPIPTA